MLAKRIIPCLDVKEGKVVKGVQFRNHEIVGNSLEMTKKYEEEGADELVFYDITASPDCRDLDLSWIEEIAKRISIPFCVAGGINSFEKAKKVLNAGADKVSINSPALEKPELIEDLARVFGEQCIVVGVDSCRNKDTGECFVYQYTGDVKKVFATQRKTMEWLEEVQDRGAGEVVLNCMNEDGMRNGYDLFQLKKAREKLKIPLIASGGAGEKFHFKEVFQECHVDGALAASVFHKNKIFIPDLKSYLKKEGVWIRI